MRIDLHPGEGVRIGDTYVLTIVDIRGARVRFALRRVTEGLDGCDTDGYLDSGVDPALYPTDQDM